MNENTNQRMNQCLRSVWARGQRKLVISGFLAFASWWVPLFLVSIIIDRYAFIPNSVRGIIALTILAVALYKAWGAGWSRLKKFNAIRTAQQIEHAHGGLDSLLVTAVQFEQSGASPGTSSDMWELTQRQAEEAAKGVQPEALVNLKDLKAPLQVSGALLATFLLVGIFNGSFLGAGLGRMYAPWLAIDYPTDTKKSKLPLKPLIHGITYVLTLLIHYGI